MKQSRIFSNRHPHLGGKSTAHKISNILNFFVRISRHKYAKANYRPDNILYKTRAGTSKYRNNVIFKIVTSHNIKCDYARRRPYCNRENSGKAGFSD